MVVIPTYVRNDPFSRRPSKYLLASTELVPFEPFEFLETAKSSRNNYVGGRLVWPILRGCGPRDPSSNLGLRPVPFYLSNSAKKLRQKTNLGVDYGKV